MEEKPEEKKKVVEEKVENKNIEKKKTKKKSKKKTKKKNVERDSRITEFIENQRVLVFNGRKIDKAGGSLVSDLLMLLPHSRNATTFEDKEKYSLKGLNDIVKENACKGAMFFRMENMPKNNLVMYLSNYPNGPTIKFKVTDVLGSKSLNLTGNCLKGSRPILHFDKNFDSFIGNAKDDEQGKKNCSLKLIKEMLIQSFATPKNHPHCKPFIDHVFSFFYVPQEKKIHFRNYQIVNFFGRNSTDVNENKERRLVEIGPRFSLEPIRVISDSFEGDVLYNDESFIPTKIKNKILGKRKRKEAKAKAKKKQKVTEILAAVDEKEMELDSIFHIDLPDEEGNENTGLYINKNFVQKFKPCHNPHCKKRETPDTKFMCCSRCGAAYYCSVKCQKADYKKHKKECIQKDFVKKYETIPKNIMNDH